MAANHSHYLESKVLTASQPQLHVMLLEAALRQCRQAQQASVGEFWVEYDAALGKGMDFVEELIKRVTGQPTEISKKLEEQYAFLYRELAVCRLTVQLDKLAACVKLLDFERETWKLVCDKSETPAVSRAPVVAPHISTSSFAAGERLSFEA